MTEEPNPTYKFNSQWHYQVTYDRTYIVPIGRKLVDLFLCRLLRRCLAVDTASIRNRCPTCHMLYH